MLDEPLTSFDVVVALEIKNLLREIKHDHVIVFSTHILQLATDLCDEIVILHDGRLSQVDHALLQSKDFEEQIHRAADRGRRPGGKERGGRQWLTCWLKSVEMKAATVAE